MTGSIKINLTANECDILESKKTRDGCHVTLKQGEDVRGGANFCFECGLQGETQCMNKVVEQMKKEMTENLELDPIEVDTLSENLTGNYLK